MRFPLFFGANVKFLSQLPQTDTLWTYYYFRLCLNNIITLIFCNFYLYSPKFIFKFATDLTYSSFYDLQHLL